MDFRKTKISLLILIFISFTVHFLFIDKHFQEIDSDVVYHSMTDFEHFSDQYTNFSYQKSPLLDLHKSYRKVLVEFVKGLQLNPYIRGFFFIPYTTTYAPFPGLFYGLIYNFFPHYDQFLKISIVSLQVLFHMSIYLLFLTLLNFGLDFKSSFLTSLIYMFSVSHYSYAFNLGSPIWTVLTAMVWLFIFSKCKNSENESRYMGWASALFVFFNYLIIVYWLGYLFYARFRTGSWSFFKNQFFALFFISLCGFLFVQPGQGTRGVTVFFSDYPTEFYFIILNFFAVFTRFDRAQFIFFMLPLMALFFYKRIKPGPWPEYLRLSLAIIIVFLGFIFVNALAFISTRHTLFLSPVFYVLLGGGIHLLFLLPRLPSYISSILVGIFSIIGFVGIHWREKETRDQLKNEQTSHVKNLVLFDSRFEFPHNNDEVIIAIPAFTIGPYRYQELSTEKTYTYLSQWVPYERFVSHSETQQLPNGRTEAFKSDKTIQILSKQSSCNEVSFMAFENFRYGFQKMNCFFMAQFRVVFKDGRKSTNQE